MKRAAKATQEKINSREAEGIEDGEDKIKRGKGFYACYLLTSLCPRFKGHTYIGFTVNPKRRIRQHNGEIRSGAFRTKKRRPWEMVFCIYGFPTNVSALQFEWAWQHPTESLAVRQAAATFKSFSGVANKIKLAYTMLNLPAWQSLNITVNYFSTQYMKHSAACLSLPEHMKVQVCPIDELPCYSETEGTSLESGETEHGFNDRENLIELRDHSIDESPCCNIGEESLSDEGAGRNCSNDDSEHNEANKTIPSSSYNLHNVDETFENFGWFKEHDKEQQHLKNTSSDYSPALKVDIVQPFVFLGSPVRICSIFSGSSIKEETCKGDGDMLNHKSLSGKADDQLSLGTVHREIEVIDLLAPSPECRITLSRKKRRLLSVVSPEIIDLT